MDVLKVYFIDDDELEAQRYIDQLKHVASDLNLQYKAPPKDLDVSTFTDASLFMVDWALDEKTHDRAVAYRGASLAAQLREEYPDVPITLVTKKPLMDRERRENFLRSLGLFNLEINKDTIISDADQVAEECRLLIGGFDKLRQSKKTWDGLLDCLDAHGDSRNLLGEADPPRLLPNTVEAETLDENPARWNIALAARWIQEVVLAYPGILYNPLHAATYLGITEESFYESSVQEIVAPAAYRGPFAPPNSYWWREKLNEVALDLIFKMNLRGSVNREFRVALEQERHVSLFPAACVVTDETPADWVCYILKKPVRIENSLAYFPDTRPAVMDDARVSFKAIRESNDVRDELFSPSSQTLLSTIRDEA